MPLAVGPYHQRLYSRLRGVYSTIKGIDLRLNGLDEVLESLHQNDVLARPAFKVVFRISLISSWKRAHLCRHSHLAFVFWEENIIGRDAVEFLASHS